MRIEKVTCDGCDSDLTTRTNSEDYRLVLANESKPGSGSGFYTCMPISPSLRRSHHFCDLNCLDHWRDRELLYGELLSKKAIEWREQKGTREHAGAFSYPDVPPEIKETWLSECRAAANEKFPLSGWKHGR